MRSLTKLFSFLSIGLFACALMAASASAQTAKVVKIVGSAAAASVTPEGGTATTVTLGMTIGKGATITTGNGVELYVEAFDGAVASIKANSRVTVDSLGAQEATLNLTSGSIVSQIDPAKKLPRDSYKIRTPKGVAAAHGTTYVVSVDFGGGTNFSTFEGTVTLTGSDGSVIQMPFGTASVNGAAALALSAALAKTPGLANDIKAAVATVSANVQSGSSGASSGGMTVQVLAAVVSAAAQAIPTEAATFTQQAITAVTASTSSSGASSGDAASAAVQAITTAAVKAAPGQAADIAKSASAAAVQSAVTNSLLAKPGDSAAAADAAQKASDSVQSAAVNALKGSGATNNEIADAVRDGSAKGTSDATTGTNVTVKAPDVSNTPPAPPAPAQTIETPKTPEAIIPVSPHE